MTTFTRSNQGFGEEEGLATGGTPMQAGMDEGARMDHGGGRQHAEMLGAAGILHRPEEEALSPQVTEVGGHALLLLSLLHHCFCVSDS